MQRLIWTIVLSFALALTLGPVLIPWFKRMKFGKTIYELGPQSHKAKQGVPQMGGIIFVVPMVAVSLVMSYTESRWSMLPAALLSTLGFGLIGFVDDYIKARKKRSLGLTPMQKIVPQVVLALAFSVWAYRNPLIGGRLIVPFANVEWDLGWFYVPAMAFIIVGTVNSANLLDGLDGLLGGCAMLDFGTFAILLMSMAATGSEALKGDLLNLMIFAGAAVGALLGFLRFNSHPASVFMGDVGSFAIGGGLVALAMLTRLSLLLPIIALTMLASSLSDIIQIGYFKLTHGKRVFRMAPLHHHFELGGVPETRIVAMYMIVTALMCLLALTTVAG
ncbi:MAG: phospho-N-acetylmuramoyl-pentapeptide-transferase [Clostridiales bacterium]|nr:phospho-N-acetylmuramoyl-pentapeptide-transferase [Clostridiales bacterium]